MKKFDKLSCIVPDEKDAVITYNSDVFNIYEVLMDIIKRLDRIDETLQVMTKNTQLINNIESYASEKLKQAENLSKVINQNTNDIRNMLGEFKGILCIVRPEVKKTGWYGEEFGAKGESISKPIEIGRCNVEIDGIDRLGVTRKKLT